MFFSMTSVTFRHLLSKAKDVYVVAITLAVPLKLTYSALKHVGRIGAKVTLTDAVLGTCVWVGIVLVLTGFFVGIPFIGLWALFGGAAAILKRLYRFRTGCLGRAVFYGCAACLVLVGLLPVWILGFFIVGALIELPGVVISFNPPAQPQEVTGPRWIIGAIIGAIGGVSIVLSYYYLYKRFMRWWSENSSELEPPTPVVNKSTCPVLFTHDLSGQAAFVFSFF